MISKQELKSLLREAAREGCRETLVQFGFDVDNPLAMQKDFQALRDWRMSMDTIQKKALKTAVGLVVIAVLSALWIGVKAYVGK